MNKESMNTTVAKFEKDISNIRVTHRALQDKLRIAYEYKDRLCLMQAETDAEIKHLQQELFEATNNIAPLIDGMKQSFQLYTSGL